MSGPQPYGTHYLDGAIDCHVHACPHLNARSADVFQAVRAAAAAGMRAIGLMDNFHNSSGFAALAMRELGDLGVEVFGGVILQPPFDVPEVGRIAMIRDATGAQVGWMTPVQQAT